MSKKQAKNEVSLGNQFSAQNTMDFIKAELAQLKAITECNYKTDGNIGISGMNNIKEETKIDNLIKAFSSINGRAAMYNEAAMELGISEFPEFKVSNGNLEDWKHDVKLRMDVIRYSDRKAELEADLAEAKSFLSEEEKKQIFLSKLSAKYGK